jgi:ABC-type antimicrobial peptide transport system permease subunit
MALRVSLGAGRFRVARQVLTESMLLAVAGGAFGSIAASLGADALLRIMISGTTMLGVLPSLDVAIDARVLLFTAAVMLAAAALSAWVRR